MSWNLVLNIGLLSLTLGLSFRMMIYGITAGLFEQRMQISKFSKMPDTFGKQAVVWGWVYIVLWGGVLLFFLNIMRNMLKIGQLNLNGLFTVIIIASVFVIYLIRVETKSKKSYPVGMTDQFTSSNLQLTIDPDENFYRRAGAIRVVSILMVLAWISISGFVLTLFVSSLIRLKHSEIIAWFLGSFFICAILYLLIVPFIQCIQCNRRMLIQWTQDSPPFSDRKYGMAGWAATIINVVFHRKFCCMYCGQRYRV